ncbi:HIRAN domain-containing protein [uncultured Methanobrevibacter sp.]|uniref:HIRAN domain-containing protein n=1 Tax=uncultured Methanobrevibacter sp. TaxID=253161 RepID=UPI0025EB7DD2|nr:HIRAN domain-containing protein [uncultured Methanobrevibacter sp.]
MNRVYQVKVVGLTFNNPSHKVETGEYVILKADEHNKFDKDAVAVYNSDAELIGHVANSERTLSLNNRKNGNISASELKGNLDFTGKEFYGEVIKAFSSCLYLEVNEGKWSYINRSVPTVAIADTVGISEVDVLKSEIVALKAIVVDLQDQVSSLKTLVTAGGDNSSSTTSDGRVLYSVVGLSHFDGQDHLGYELSIAEEPIYEGAKGTALYLKSGKYRVGVFPSFKKKQYCLDHNIPYCDSKTLKGKSFEGNVVIEEIVYGEYAVVSV